MIHAEKLILYLDQENIVDIKEIMTSLRLSERSARSSLNDARSIGQNHGFDIKTIRNQGYLLVINDEQAFESFKKELNQERPYPTGDDRLYGSALFLLQNSATHYVTYEEIAAYFQIPRSSIISDRKDLEKFFEAFNCQLQSKSHYGLKVKGIEKDIREILFHIFKEANHLIPFSAQQQIFYEEIIIQSLSKNNLFFEKSFVDELILRVMVSIMRDKSGHQYQSNTNQKNNIREEVLQASYDMMAKLQHLYQAPIPNENIYELASFINARVSTRSLNVDKELLYSSTNLDALKSVDELLMSDFQKDEFLLKNLNLHLHSLLLRTEARYIMPNMSLEFIKSSYFPAFLTANLFYKKHEILSAYDLSESEIASMALFFQSSLEYYFIEKRKEIKRINLISNSIYSHIELLTVLLKKHFPHAEIIRINQNFEEIKANDPILVTPESHNIPLPKTIHPLYISILPQEKEFMSIKRYILAREIFKQETLLDPHACFIPPHRWDIEKKEALIPHLIEDEMLPKTVEQKAFTTIGNCEIFTEIRPDIHHSFLTYQIKNDSVIVIYLYLKTGDYYLYFDLKSILDFVETHTDILFSHNYITIEHIIGKEKIFYGSK